MMRTRLLLTLGVVLTLTGLVVAAIALVWLATNWDSGPHIYDPGGALYKQVSMARFGLIVGVVGATAGIAMGTAGLVLLKRTS